MEKEQFEELQEAAQVLDDGGFHFAAECLVREIRKYGLPETKRIGSSWTIQYKDVLGRYACYLGDCLMMSGATMEEAEQKVRESLAKTNPGEVF